MHSGVIGGQCERDITVVERKQVTELLGASANVLDWIVDIHHPQCGRRIRRQLHEPHGTLSRNDVGTEIRLNFDDRAQKCWVESVAFRVKGDRSPDFLFAIARTAIIIGFRRERGRNNDYAGC